MYYKRRVHLLIKIWWHNLNSYWVLNNPLDWRVQESFQGPGGIAAVLNAGLKFGVNGEDQDVILLVESMHAEVKSQNKTYSMLCGKESNLSTSEGSFWNSWDISLKMEIGYTWYSSLRIFDSSLWTDILKVSETHESLDGIQAWEIRLVLVETIIWKQLVY